MRIRALLIIVLILAFPGAWAHSPDKLRPARALHGGELKTVGHLRMELLATTERAYLYLRDDRDRPVDPGVFAIDAKRWSQMQSLPVLEDGRRVAIGVSSREVAGDRLLIVLREPGREPLRAIFGPFAESDKAVDQ